MPCQKTIRLRDYTPQLNFKQDVLEGLRRPQKRLHCKYLYDKRGSELFDRITDLEEYYLTRTELGIMRGLATEIGNRIGPRCLLIECGSGSSLKTRILLDSLEDVAAYVPVDISREHLLESSKSLQETYPELEILPICADFTQPVEPLVPKKRVATRVVYFPGSTIGNFSPDEARIFLSGIARLCQKGGRLLIGIDLKKDRELLELAYDDPGGITAAFNLNLLVRINKELNGNFDLDHFSHRARYDATHGRVEIQIMSNVKQTVVIDHEEFSFEKNETILTEYSHKFDLQKFAELASSVGFDLETSWSDAEKMFSVMLLRAREVDVPATHAPSKARTVHVPVCV